MFEPTKRNLITLMSVYIFVMIILGISLSVALVYEGDDSETMYPSYNQTTEERVKPTKVPSSDRNNVKCIIIPVPVPHPVCWNDN